MKKLFILLLAICLAALPALAAPAPVVSDAAGVLDTGLVDGIQTLNKETEQKLDIRLRILTRHFLGGAQASAFAEETRQLSENPDQTILLVMVIGEERYALSMGKAPEELLGRDAVNNLLASAFRVPYLARDYDGALKAFMAGLVTRMQSASGETLDTTGLFAQARPEPQPLPKQDPLDSFFREWDKSADDARRYEEETGDPGRGGLSVWQIALIGFILYKLFGTSRRTGKRRGCGPLGWIFGAWGISKFFGFRK